MIALQKEKRMKKDDNKKAAIIIKLYNEVQMLKANG